MRTQLDMCAIQFHNEYASELTRATWKVEDREPGVVYLLSMSTKRRVHLKPCMVCSDGKSDTGYVDVWQSTKL